MKLKALAMAAMVGLGTLPMALQAAEVPEGPHVVTSGTASVDATPDIATLAIEVSVSSKDAAQAKKQVDERVAQYFDFLQKNNIEKKDISAANLRTQPEYDYLKTGESVLKGYRAVRQVQVTLRQLDKLNELLDGALKSGLNEIRAVELGVAKPDVYREQARQKRSRTRLSRPNPWPKASTPSWGRCTAFATGLPTTSRCRWRGCIRRPVRRRKATRRKPMNSKAFTSTIRWMWCSSCSATPCSKVFVLKKRFAAANLFVLILTQHLVAVFQQRVGHFAHHAAFRREAVPVQHAALVQPGVRSISSPDASSFRSAGEGSYSRWCPGVPAARRLPTSSRCGRARCPATDRSSAAGTPGACRRDDRRPPPALSAARAGDAAREVALGEAAGGHEQIVQCPSRSTRQLGSGCG